MERKIIRNFEPMIMVQKAEIYYKDERCKEEKYKELVETLYNFFTSNPNYFGEFLKRSRHNVYKILLNEYEDESFDYTNEEVLIRTIKNVLIFIDVAKAIDGFERRKNE